MRFSNLEQAVSSVNPAQSWHRNEACTEGAWWPWQRGGSGLRAGQLMTQVWDCPPGRPCVPPKQAGRCREEWPQHSHAVSQLGPPNLKQAKIMWMVKSYQCPPGRAGGKPQGTCHGEGSNAGPGTLPPRHQRTILGQLCLSWGWPQGIAVASAGHVALHCWPRQQRWVQRHPAQGRRGSKEFICMLWLHPASTKLPADEHRRTSCLFPNLRQQKQGGEGEGE